MDYKKVFWGVFLIVIGILFILKQAGIIYFHIFHILQLWPVLLLYWGISMLPAKNRTKIILTLVSLFLVMGLVYFLSVRHPASRCPFWHRLPADTEENWFDT